jgi:hypothetical protein
MNVQRREILLLAALAATLSFGLTIAPAKSAEPTPNLTGFWRHQSLPGFEPLASGPTSVTNRSRRNGVSDYDRLVGDYTNPILKPEAAATVKKFGEMSMAGITYPNPANQCWPEPVPFIYKNFGMQMLQKPDEITIMYDEGPDVRHVRMNQPHPAQVTPSWYGDSVGHYEGDTLVIDTIGTRTDRPFAMIDLYGTPYTKALHVVERYRLIDYDAAQEGLRRDAKENRLIPGDIDPNYRGKFLQVMFTVEDEGVFTTPWTATVTYRPARVPWQEIVCAENTHEYYNNKDSDVPTAAKPDF